MRRDHKPISATCCPKEYLVVSLTVKIQGSEWEMNTMARQIVIERSIMHLVSQSLCAINFRCIHNSVNASFRICYSWVIEGYQICLPNCSRSRPIDGHNAADLVLPLRLIFISVTNRLDPCDTSPIEMRLWSHSGKATGHRR